MAFRAACRLAKRFFCGARALLLVGVTWRMYVPMLGLFFAGLWLDSLFNSKPWLMFSGFAVGAAAAVILVRQQIKKVNKK